MATEHGEAVGTAISPCTLACPLGINVQRYVGLAQRGLLVEALESILEHSPLPGVCGYLCQRPCEASCRRAAIDRPVAIRWLKKAAAGAALAAGARSPWLSASSRPHLGAVAVVGAGPAGLSSAWALARTGHQVTLFERRADAGGLLDEVVPDFRLPRRVLRADVERILSHPAITLRAGVDVGRSDGDALAELRRAGAFAAVLLATGAGREPPPSLKVTEPVVDVAGVTTPLGVLRRTDGAAPTGHDAYVMGGTNAAVAAARMLCRAGWSNVTLVAGRTFSRWPADAGDLHGAGTDGVGFLDETLIEEMEIAEGRLVALRGRRATCDGLGRPRPSHAEAERFSADLLVVDTPRLPDIPPGDGMERAPIAPGALLVDAVTMQTTRPGVFAAGECATGAKTVVEAMAAGKRAAAAIHRYIEGRPLDIAGTRPRVWAELVVHDRPEADGTAPPERRDGNIEVAPSTAAREAQRCLRCGPCAECDLCSPACRYERALLPMPPEAALQVVRLPAGAASVDELQAVRITSPSRCTGCGRCEEACPHQAVTVSFRAGQGPQASVNRPACRGCGRCVPACPFGAIELAPGRGDAPLLWQAISEEVR